MIKKLIAVFFVVLTVATLMLPVAIAAEIPNEIESASEVSPRVTEYEWYFRIYNGRPQRRLWNVTERRWETDWEYTDV